MLDLFIAILPQVLKLVDAFTWPAHIRGRMSSASVCPSSCHVLRLCTT
ncbi:hypothetical protein ABZW96_00765 [Nocardia sp. NPDC004168]